MEHDVQCMGPAGREREAVAQLVRWRTGEVAKWWSGEGERARTPTSMPNHRPAQPEQIRNKPSLPDSEYVSHTVVKTTLHMNEIRSSDHCTWNNGDSARIGALGLKSTYNILTKSKFRKNGFRKLNKLYLGDGLTDTIAYINFHPNKLHYVISLEVDGPRFWIRLKLSTGWKLTQFNIQSLESSRIQPVVKKWIIAFLFHFLS